MNDLKDQGCIVFNDEVFAPPVQVKNFLELDVERFKIRKPIKKQKFIVLHENAGSINLKNLYKYLNKKGYGYHLIVDHTGGVTQHGDLADAIWHGGRCNRFGIGICTLNPYYPRLLDTPTEKKFYSTIPAPWWAHCENKKDKRVVVPNKLQLQTLVNLIPFLCELLGVPLEFPTRHLNAKQRKIKYYRLPGRRPAPGIIAHRDYSSHADGRFALEFLIKKLG